MIDDDIRHMQAQKNMIDSMVLDVVARVRRASAYLVAVIDVSNAAHDHKAQCDHNCNVSLGGLIRAAKFLAALVDDSERDEAERIVNAMPRL